MNEMFAPKPEPSVEQEITREAVEKDVEHVLEEAAKVRDLLIDVNRMLEEKIPHNDVIVEDEVSMTLDPHVLLNAWRGKLFEVGTIEEEFWEIQEELQAGSLAA